MEMCTPVRALEPLDDPRLDLKLSVSPAALMNLPVAWTVACARVMARSARVAYASTDEKMLKWLEQCSGPV